MKLGRWCQCSTSIPLGLFYHFRVHQLLVNFCSQQQQLEGCPQATLCLQVQKHKEPEVSGNVCHPQDLMNDEFRSISTPAPLPLTGMGHLLLPRLPCGIELKSPSKGSYPILDIVFFLGLPSFLILFPTSLIHFHLHHHIRGCFGETNLRHTSSSSRLWHPDCSFLHSVNCFFLPSIKFRLPTTPIQQICSVVQSDKAHS